MASVKKAMPTMVVASALLLLSACASAPPNDSEVTGMHGSRTVLYQDVEHLLGDSTIVVRGVVVEQITAEDQGITQTLSTLEVTESFAVAESDEGAPLASVVVRQYRDGDYSELPAPLLEQGRSTCCSWRPLRFGDTTTTSGSQAGKRASTKQMRAAKSTSGSRSMRAMRYRNS